MTKGSGTALLRREDIGEHECREGLSKCTEESLEKDRMGREAAAVSTSESTSTSVLIVCDTCRRSFRRRQDIARHKCQRTRDVRSQATPHTGSVRRPSRAEATTAQLVCGICKRSFRRRQDIARHKCQTTRLRGSVQ